MNIPDTVGISSPQSIAKITKEVVVVQSVYQLVFIATMTLDLL